jgi:flagellar basal body-associated protein FliL
MELNSKTDSKVSRALSIAILLAIGILLVAGLVASRWFALDEGAVIVDRECASCPA